MKKSNTEQYLRRFEQWYNDLNKVKANAGPANGTIAAALVVLEKLKINYDLDIKQHLAKGGAQIRGVSGKTVATILSSFEETRPFAKEGGRTNRGVPNEITNLLFVLNDLAIAETERVAVLTKFQSFLVARINDFHNRQRLKLSFNHTYPIRQVVIQLLKDAKETGKAGPVAQHLVGAKLQLRYPLLHISNESSSTADKPTGRDGDFIVGNTIFHVTVAPMMAVYEKCRENIAKGLRTFLLVPDERLLSARQNMEDICGKNGLVEPIESFVSQNIEEIGSFHSETIQSSFSQLIELYNKRVNEVEMDKSIMIELPENLK